MRIECTGLVTLRRQPKRAVCLASVIILKRRDAIAEKKSKKRKRWQK